MKKQYFLLLILGISMLNLSAQAPHLFGVTTNGGTNDFGNGTIFRTDTNGTNYSLIDTFDVKTDGGSPTTQQLVEVGGKLYGVTVYGGDNNLGTLFEFDPSTKAYTVKHSFIDSTGTYPNGFLMLASNGNLYGTAYNGGVNSNGTFFEYNVTSGVYTKMGDFNNTTIGGNPKGRLVESATGVIYGVCSSGGGVPNHGTVFQYTISTNTLIKKDNFNANVNGSSPSGGLMKANNGKLYGMAYSGGANSYGTLFEYNLVADSIKKLFDFDALNGRSPHSNLIQAANGKLYGTTQYGGQSSGTGRGVLFEYNITTDSLKKLKAFDSWTGGAGYYASGGLIESTTGKFLICMRTGGPNQYAGAIAEYTISTNSLIGKSYFDRYKNGSAPQGEVVKSSITGKFYGVTNVGGSGDRGVIFEFDNTLDTLLNVKDFSAAYDGKTPTYDLLHASNGKIYGITSKGGNGNGTIIEVNPNTHDVEKKADFEGSNGTNPIGALAEVNGKIYGTTMTGGNFGRGVLYAYDMSTFTITKLFDFSTMGINYPSSGVTKATNGKLYGTTSNGGNYGRGVLFEYDITLDTLIIKDHFGNVDRGYTASGKIMQASNGKLYGTTEYGGKNNKGTIYQFDFAVDSIKFIAHFNDTNGSRPAGGLIQTSTGKFYGMTQAGNSALTTSNSYGVVYEFDVMNDTVIPKANFGRYTHGAGGAGELLESSNGKLYGLASNIGSVIRAANGSKIVEFNPVTNSLLSIHTLTGSCNGSLIEVVSSNTASLEEETINDLTIYPNPTSSILNIDTKGARIESIKVFTISGKLINSELNTNTTIDVSTYKSGMYILQIETQNGITLSRFIKK